MDFSARIDEKSPTINESQFVLEYKAPAFKASATIQIAPMARQEKWKVGFIQAVSDSVLDITYGKEGCLSWEFRRLQLGIQMVNDSFGHHYPWVGPNDQTVISEGPCSQHQSATIKMSDSMSASAYWRYPDPRNHQKPNLTNIFREVTLNVWVVALNMSKNKAYVLKMVRWSTHLNIDVDPTKPLGRRTTLRSDPAPRQPTEMQDVPVPCCALFPPCANSAPMLVWRPRNGQPICIQPPKHKINPPGEVHFDIDRQSIVAGLVERRRCE